MMEATSMIVLQELMKEVEQVEGVLYSPKSTFDKNAVVLGECDEIEKKLYGLAQLAKRECERAHLEWRHADDESEEERNWAELVQRHHYRHKVFMALFWYSLQQRLGLWGKQLALKVGWKVVKEDAELGGLRGLLDQLGGGGRE